MGIINGHILAAADAHFSNAHNNADSTLFVKYTILFYNVLHWCIVAS